jgi:hypothetical protein
MKEHALIIIARPDHYLVPYLSHTLVQHLLYPLQPLDSLPAALVNPNKTPAEGCSDLQRPLRALVVSHNVGIVLRYVSHTAIQDLELAIRNNSSNNPNKITPSARVQHLAQQAPLLLARITRVRSPSFYSCDKAHSSQQAEVCLAALQTPAAMLSEPLIPPLAQLPSRHREACLANQSQQPTLLALEQPQISLDRNLPLPPLVPLHRQTSKSLQVVL